METKTCFKCGEEKPLDEFYRHPMMADGHLGKCRECTKKDVRENRTKRRKHYSEYDRERYRRPERRAYQQEQQKRYRARNPEKTACRRKFRYALRAGKIENPGVCSSCGADDVRIEGHHPDYSSPLSVEWLCFRCHRAVHGQVVVTSNPDYSPAQGGEEE